MLGYVQWIVMRNCACRRTFSPGSVHSAAECRDIYTNDRAQRNHLVLPWLPNDIVQDPSRRIELAALLKKANRSRFLKWWNRDLLNGVQA